jgi:hypothetical protein
LFHHQEVPVQQMNKNKGDDAKGSSNSKEEVEDQSQIE